VASDDPDLKEINIELLPKPKSKLVQFSGKKGKAKKSKRADDPVEVVAPKQTTEQHKTDVTMTLERELTRLIKFRKDVCDCLGFQSEKIIRDIIMTYSTIIDKVRRQCVEKEQDLRSILEMIQKLPPNKEIPRGNFLYERIRECPELSSLELLSLQANVKEFNFVVDDVLSVEMRWSSIPSIENVRTYYEQHQAKIPTKLKETFRKVMDEEHYSIRKLSLSKISLKAEGMRHLIKVLGYLPQLEILKLSSNSLGHDGAEVFAEVLPILRSLQRLDLADNDIGSRGFKAIHETLGELKELAYLNLSKNNLGASGIRHVTITITRLPKLRDLDLSSNNMGAEGARQFATVLSKLTALRTLGLRENNLGNESARHLSSALGKLSRLEFLKLEHNILGAEDKKVLKSIVNPKCKVDF
jgi:Leucine-rich repeat (LRR) protein